MPEPLRYVLTGAPGAGKTTVLEALRHQGYATVREAATDVIAERQAQGCAEPWREPAFVDAVQRHRQIEADGPPVAPVDHGLVVADELRNQGDAGHHNSMIDASLLRRPTRLYDRSPLCTLALARHLGRPVGPTLAAEVDRIARQRIYQRTVFLVSPLGFITRTAARRISYAESLAFARVHEQVYEAYGHHLVHVPAGPVPQRVALIEEHLSALGGGSLGSPNFT
ncbi:AAA family ATPase [Micromonospora sp. ALFpr18c]|uniref:AAA family ATPase n=1 Tax=unclassified Micromonospora TaxID=2617518 RepID=UPI00124B2006|nr:AAA family ATPase [Micromonospora sp. ALFpr18c]KAB1941499.1 AAA family ATPase [Micromonospora sp. ALFpr18c]